MSVSPFFWVLLSLYVLVTFFYLFGCDNWHVTLLFKKELWPMMVEENKKSHDLISTYFTLPVVFLCFTWHIKEFFGFWLLFLLENMIVWHLKIARKSLLIKQRPALLFKSKIKIWFLVLEHWFWWSKREKIKRQRVFVIRKSVLRQYRKQLIRLAHKFGCIKFEIFTTQS